MAGESRSTTDHTIIRKWAEVRRGRPAWVKWAFIDGGVGRLRIDFPGYRGADVLERISWEEFFATFDEKKLTFVYQECTSSGEESRFYRFVSCEGFERKAEYHYAY